jgi:hypothetical protein
MNWAAIDEILNKPLSQEPLARDLTQLTYEMTPDQRAE